MNLCHSTLLAAAALLGGSLPAQTWNLELRDFDLIFGASAMNDAGDMLVAAKGNGKDQVLWISAAGTLTRSHELLLELGNDPEIHAAALAEDGLAVVAGVLNIIDSTYAWVAAIDPRGFVAWSHVAANVGSEFEGVLRLENGDFVCYGEAYAAESTTQFAVCYGSDGREAWRRSFTASPGFERITDAVQRDDGDLMFVAHAEGPTLSTNWVVTRMRPWGTVVHSAAYLTPENVVDGQICMAEDGGFYLAGTHADRDNERNTSIAVYRVDANNAYLWTRSFLSFTSGSDREDRLGVAGMVPRPEGGVAILANQPTTFTTNHDDDLALLLVSAEGHSQGYHNFGVVGRDEAAVGLHSVPGAGYAMVGVRSPRTSFANVQVLCVDKDAQVRCSPQPDLPVTAFNLANGYNMLDLDAVQIAAHTTNPPVGTRATYVLTRQMCANAAITEGGQYGIGLGGHQGLVPQLGTENSFLVNNTPVVRVWDARVDAPGVLVVGTGSAFDIAFGGQILVNLNGPVWTFPFVTTPNGQGGETGYWSMRCPELTDLAGLSLFLQAAVLDADAPFGLALSNGLLLRMP